MSAYIVSNAHVAFMVRAATSRALGTDHPCLSWFWAGSRTDLRAGQAEEEQRVGQLLRDENVASVRYRYPDTDELPGLIGDDYSFTAASVCCTHPEVTPARVLKACDGYEYQACEHPGWEASEAKAFVDALRSRAWRSVKGYEEAAWEVGPLVND